jgi:Ankyrin repeats (3 copies)
MQASHQPTWIEQMKNLLRLNRIDDLIHYINRESFHIQDVDTEGNTLLHFAVILKKIPVIRCILGLRNCNMIVQNNAGETAFFIACKNGYIFMVNIFFELATRIQKRHLIMTSEFSEGFSPLLIAYRNGHYPICKALINKGADYNASNWSGLRISRIHLDTVFRDCISRFVARQTRRRNRERRQEIYYPVTQSVQPTEPIKVEPPNHLLNEHAGMLVELKRQCPICFEEYKKDGVMFIKECHHPVCVDCHPRLTKCHFCRK